MKKMQSVVHRSGFCGLQLHILFILLVSMNADGAVYPRLTPDAALLLDPRTSCYQDTRRLVDALQNKTLWAERIWDSSARDVVGGLWGAQSHLGSFDGCLTTGLVSPVGARYCLASLTVDQRTCGKDIPFWDQVGAVHPNADALDVVQGCGMDPSSVPLGEVKVALCVPGSCTASDMTTALESFLGLLRPATIFRVNVADNHCVGHSEARGFIETPQALVFWLVVLLLTATAACAPYLGWSAWDWRTHFAELSRPEESLAGMDLSPLAGIRILTMITVVTVHRFYNALRMPLTTKVITLEARRNLFMAIGFHVSVFPDTFLFISGLLLTLTGRHRHHPAVAIFHRYLRLTPSYAVVVVFIAAAMESLASGPLWRSITEYEAGICRRWGWTNLLYINNYVGEMGDALCAAQTWSLAVDMQMSVLWGLLLHYDAGEGRLATPLLSLGLAAAMGAPFVATLVRDLPAIPTTSERVGLHASAYPEAWDAYVPTHMRATPYVVGLIAGHMMLNLKKKQATLGTLATAVTTWSSLAVMGGVLVSSILFADTTQPPVGPLWVAAYVSLSPAVWSAALAALVFALTFGQQSAVSSFLRWHPLVTLSRLSYGVYLVHFSLQQMQAGAERSPVHVSLLTGCRDAISDVAVALVVSLWLYVVVEAPVRRLARATCRKGVFRTTHVKKTS